MAFVEIAVLIASLPILAYLANRYYFSGGRCTSDTRLDDKTVIITGANTGIGLETALDLAKRGARLIVACRDMKKAQEAVDEVKRRTGNNQIECEHLDLVDLDSVRSFAAKMNKKLTKLDILINNAGVMMCPNWKTKQGFEMQFGVNHLAHFLLTNLLLDLLRTSKTARVINVSSRAHYDFGMNWDDLNWEKSYSPIRAYAQSKLCNVLFSKELAKRYGDSGIISVSLHPGVVRTELTRHIGDSLLRFFPFIFWLATPIYWVFTKSSEEGAQTTIHCCVSDDIIQYNGCYFTDCKLLKPSEQARNKEYASRLWDVSAKFVGLEKAN